MKRKNRTHEDYVADVYKILPDVEVLSEFTCFKDWILVKNKYGVCKVKAQSLTNGYNPTIVSSIDKTSYFKNMVSEIHENKYDYSKTIYTGVKNKLIITCPTHGDFVQVADSHIQKKGCSLCAKIKSAESARNQATGWKYSDWEKAGSVGDHFDCFKLYIIELKNNEEFFYKVGKTFNTIERRFGKFKLPYELKELYSQCGSALHISKLENYLKNQNKANKYLPKQVFGGMHECFSSIQDLEQIIKDPTYWDRVFLK